MNPAQSADSAPARWPIQRWSNIALRTAHIATMALLVGGHAFAPDPKGQLPPVLWACVVTGVLLAALETGGSLVWLHQLRGLATLAKLGLIALVPLLWPWRLSILLAVVILACVSSHMPARLRYYSVVYRRVIKCGQGPGLAEVDDEAGS